MCGLPQKEPGKRLQLDMMKNDSVPELCKIFNKLLSIFNTCPRTFRVTLRTTQFSQKKKRIHAKLSRGIDN